MEWLKPLTKLFWMLNLYQWNDSYHSYISRNLGFCQNVINQLQYIRSRLCLLNSFSIIFPITSLNCLILFFVFSSGLRNFHQPPHTPYDLLQFLFSDGFTIMIFKLYFLMFLVPNFLAPRAPESIVWTKHSIFLTFFVGITTNT